MNAPIKFLPKAQRDLLEHVLYFAANSDEDAADRYYDAVIRTTQLLAAQPEMGVEYSPDSIEMSAIRRFPVTQPYGKYLIFYSAAKHGIKIIRVLHGTRDIGTILGF